MWIRQIHITETDLDHRIFPDMASVNQRTEYLGRLIQKFLFEHTDTHHDDCSTWTTKQRWEVSKLLPRLKTVFSLLWSCLGRESQCLGLDPSLDALVNSALHPSGVA